MSRYVIEFTYKKKEAIPLPYSADDSVGELSADLPIVIPQVGELVRGARLKGLDDNKFYPVESVRHVYSVDGYTRTIVNLRDEPVLRRVRQVMHDGRELYDPPV
jgi:hypothetical protein